MKGYWLILGTEITDKAAQAEYGKLWAPIAARYGARLNPGAAPVLTEARHASRVVVVEFPSLAAAKACYDDPEYRTAMQHALKASKRELVMFEGELA